MIPSVAFDFDNDKYVVQAVDDSGILEEIAENRSYPTLIFVKAKAIETANKFGISPHRVFHDTYYLADQGTRLFGPVTQ